jgi:hypothetical protein
MHVLEICPTSERIIQDTDKVFRAITMVITSEGCVIQDVNEAEESFNTREGHRAAAARVGVAPAQRGGNRPRKQAVDDYNQHPWHNDAHAGVNVKIEAARQKFEQN